MNLQKTRRYEDPAYLAWIRTQPCCHCLCDGTVAHHMIGIGGRMGSKMGDHFAMPMCVKCHSDLHTIWMRDDKAGAIAIQSQWVHDLQARYKQEVEDE